MAGPKLAAHEDPEQVARLIEQLAQHRADDEDTRIEAAEQLAALRRHHGRLKDAAYARAAMVGDLYGEPTILIEHRPNFKKRILGIMKPEPK